MNCYDEFDQSVFGFSKLLTNQIFSDIIVFKKIQYNK